MLFSAELVVFYRYWGILSCFKRAQHYYLSFSNDPVLLRIKLHVSKLGNTRSEVGLCNMSNGVVCACKGQEIRIQTIRAMRLIISRGEIGRAHV